tara:strand:+ start:152 stop:424 length:273 start_codon:yes stop_codon:yes gene_type:complete
MSSEKLSSDVSSRICQHMNSDHKDALVQYAIHYGEIDTCKEVTMTKLTSKYLELDVDRKLIRINFDHSLKDSQDAHKTLVAMMKALPKGS